MIMQQTQRTHLKINVQISTLGNGLDAFLLDCQARRLSQGTLRFYRQKLQPFVRYLQQQNVVNVDEITPTHIRLFLVQLQDTGHNGGGQHAYARAIRAWLRFLVNEDMLAVSPMRKVRMPKQDNRILPAFSHDDVEQLLLACDHRRDLALILFMLDTGCRASELLAINVEDIDLADGIVRVHRGKGGKGRIIYIGAKSRRALQRYIWTRKDITSTSPLWITLRGSRRLTYDGLRSILVRLGKGAGVDHCHPHTFRRTCALWSLRAGMNIYALQQIMGHADLTVLRRYLALVQEDLEDAHRKHGAVDNML